MKKSFPVLLVLIVALLGAAVGMWLLLRPSPTHCNLDRALYPVRGIDISAHNGVIHFDRVAADSVDFVFIKASEGTDFRDPKFIENYDSATAAGLPVGAYHFFSFNTSGSEQALNFVQALDGRIPVLPLVIDVEEWGNAAETKPGDVSRQLRGMIDVLSSKGYRVMIYTNRNGYGKFIGSRFNDVPLWMCSLLPQQPADGWTFWQYCHRGSVSGITGDVDLNTFCGDRQAWIDFIGRDTAMDTQ